MTKAVKLLRELVALPSVNPAFLPARHPCAGERRVAEFLAATGASAGLEVEFREVMPGRANLFLRLLPKGKPRRRVLLAPHLDTVNAADSQFAPQIKNGKLFGRGACDTKGSVAAMSSALCECAISGQRPTETEVVFVGLIDEEHAQNGSRALAADHFKADLALVGEPTSLRVVTAHKGSLWLRLQTRGKAAHGAQPHLGKNAVYTMAAVVRVIEGEYARLLAGRRHPLLGAATVSVGAISGGTQANIVPDSCTIQVDRRTLPGETEAGVWRELNGLLKKRNLRATCAEDKLFPCLPLETDSKLPLVASLMRAVGQRRPAGVDYFCDASVLAHGGIPSVAFGPGDIAQAHTADEWLPLNELERATSLLTRFIRSLP